MAKNPVLLPDGPHPAFAETTLPRDGQVGEGVSPALDASCILNRIVCSSNRTGTQLSSICELGCKALHCVFCGFNLSIDCVKLRLL